MNSAGGAAAHGGFFAAAAARDAAAAAAAASGGAQNAPPSNGYPYSQPSYGGASVGPTSTMSMGTAPPQPPPPAAPAATAQPGSYAARSAQAFASQASVAGSMSSSTMAHSVAPPPPNPSSNVYAAAAGVVPAAANQVRAPVTATHHMNNAAMPASSAAPRHRGDPTAAQMAEQARILADSTRRVQEAAYYMRRAVEADDLPVVLEKAAAMLAELGDPNHPSSASQQPSNQPPSGGPSLAPHLGPKGYYELHMRALNEMPNLEEYLLGLAGKGGLTSTNNEGGPPVPATPGRFTMKELYEAVQYCPRVVPRLYLQICAGSALIRSGEVGAKYVLNELVDAVKCVQSPLRGLFLRHYLLQAIRDKLPDAEIDTSPQPLEEGNDGKAEEAKLEGAADAAKIDENDTGNVEDAYKFVLANFIDMNKLWVRIQHMPGGGRGDKEERRRRERERNELRILVGTNLVRLSQLDGVTSAVYGTVILPKILDQIIACRDALAQAYLLDCIIQVFPDEFHIQTLEVVLSVVPKLREKVNVRTILQSIMDRLSNYYADASLLAGEDSDGLKNAVALDSFQMFDECITRVFEARGSSMPPREVIRLETSLLNFSLKCYPGQMDHISRCLGICAKTLRGEDSSGAIAAATAADTASGSVTPATVAITPRRVQLDDSAIDELEKMLSIPLDSLALRVLELENYSELLTFLPWDNRRQVAVVMLRAVETSGTQLKEVSQIEELFSIITPLIKDEQVANGGSVQNGGVDSVNRTANLMGSLGISSDPGFLPTSGVAALTAQLGDGGDPNVSPVFREEQALVARLVHLLDDNDTDVAFEMLSVARKHLADGGRYRVVHTLVPVVFSMLQLLGRVHALQFPPLMPTSTVEKTDNAEEKDETTVQEKEAGEESKDGKAQDGEENSEKVEDSGEAEAETKETNEETEDTAASEEKNDNEGDEKNEGAERSEGSETEATEHKVDSSPPPFSKDVNCRKIFLFLQKTVSILASSDPELGFHLYLQIALTSNRFAAVTKRYRPGDGADFCAIGYELMAQAFIIYENEVSDSKAQHRAIVAIVGTLLKCRTFEREDYEALITKTAQYAAKLLKKADQCKMVILCSHLFYTGNESDPTAYRNPPRVLECLQRALKIADACTMTSPSNVQLFVDILDRYLFFFEQNNPVITDKFISGLVALISEHLENVGGNAGSLFGADAKAVQDARSQFDQIVQYVRRKKAEGVDVEKFSPIVC